jgi:hypothetical protein
MKIPCLDSLALATLCALAPAQTLEVFFGVDLGAKTTSVQCKVVGAPGATVGLFAAGKLSAGTRLPAGTVYLDLASLAPLATFPLNTAGVGSVTFTLPAASFRTLTADLQAAVATSAGAVTLTNYVMVGHWANTLLTEILAARYDPRADQFLVQGKGPSGALMELFRETPPAARVRLGGITTPIAMMAWGLTPCLFRPLDRFEVYVFGVTRILRLE